MLAGYFLVTRLLIIIRHRDLFLLATSTLKGPTSCIIYYAQAIS